MPSALSAHTGIHRKFATLQWRGGDDRHQVLLKLHHDPHPWDDLWRSVVVEHPLRDAWWEDRNIRLCWNM